MWPNSGFATPVSSYQRPMPLVLFDGDAPPLRYVAISEHWIPFILGSLKQLLLQTTWQYSTTEELALVQQRASDLLTLISLSTNSPPCVVRKLIEESEYQMAICEQLRFHDGKLQGLCCGEWVDIEGQDRTVLDGGRQPEGRNRPPQGECYTFPVTLRGDSTFIMPFSVNEGDTIEITQVHGLWTDGSGFWWYGNGDSYFGGARIPDCSHKVGDLDDTLCHMGLLAHIGAIYHDAYNRIITVPSGISNGQVVFTPNDGSLNDNGGEITFTVEYCNNGTPVAPDWCVDIDLKAINIFTPYGAGQGAWSSGIGIVAEDVNLGGFDRRILQGYLTLPSVANLTNISYTYDYTVGTSSPSYEGATLAFESASIQKLSSDMVTGDNQTLELNLDQTGTQIFVELQPSVGAFSGAATLTAVHFEGKGDNPYGASNC